MSGIGGVELYILKLERLAACQERRGCNRRTKLLPAWLAVPDTVLLK